MITPSPDPTPFHPPIRVEFKAPPRPGCPNGGATVYVDPSKSGNPYANIEEQEVPVVVVELPEMEDGSEGS